MGNEIVRVAQNVDKYESGAKTKVRLTTDSITVNIMSPPHVDGPVTSATYTPAGTGQVPLWVFRIGKGGFAGIEPELSTDTAEAIRDASPFESTFVMSMFEGGAKNMPEASQYPSSPTRHWTASTPRARLKGREAARTSAAIDQVVDR